MAPKAFSLKDPCPGCGGQLRKCPQPTPAMRKQADSTQLTYVPIPPHYDTAPIEVVQELGELWKCPGCGYPHREKPAAAPPVAEQQ